MTIIDFSGYYGLWPHWPIQTTTLADLTAMMDRTGIDQMIAASTRSILNEMEEGNQELAGVAESSNGRVHAFAVVDPTQPSACEELGRAAMKGMKGVRITPQHHGYHLDDDPALNEFLSLAQDMDMVVVIPIRLILHWGLPQLDVREINTAAANFPRLKIVIGGVNYGEFREALAVLRRHENVGFETSCMQKVNGIELLVQKAGAERIYFGTGAPLMYPAPGLFKIEKAQISSIDRDLILGGNAARVLGIIQ